MMFLLLLILQISQRGFNYPEKVIYYNVPSYFIPYISFTNAYNIPENYRIKRGDILLFVFYGTFNQTYMQQVTNSGDIWIITSPTMLQSEKVLQIKGPNLGFFKVEGKTLKEIEEEVNKKLKEKFEGVVLKVFIAELGQIKVHVVGNIPDPGVYTVNRLNRVYDVLKLAGIKNELNKVILKRANTKDTLFIEKYLKEGDLSQNPYLENNDIIIVP